MTQHIIAAITSLAILIAFVAGLHSFVSSLDAVSHSSIEAYAESAWQDFEASHPY